MSFWGNLQQETERDSAEVGGGNFTPIPDGTKIVAMITEAKWDNTERDGDFIKLRWDVVQEGEHKGRVIFHKVKVMEPDDAKAEKHKRMLMVIDHHCGGQLIASGEAPTDYTLQRLLQKPMVIKVGEWCMYEGTSEEMRGNWVMAVEGRNKTNNPPQQPKPQQPGPDAEGFDDDIPF